MKKHFEDYLNSIKVTEILKKRINEIYEFCNFACPEEIMEIFVSDYFTKDGERLYYKICFFSDTFYMETTDFETNDNFYITPLKRTVSVSIDKEHYNFKKATENSKLSLNFSFPEEEKHISAAKNNCDYLMNILTNYFLQNLQPYQEPLSTSNKNKGFTFVLSEEKIPEELAYKKLITEQLQKIIKKRVGRYKNKKTKQPG